MLAMALAVGTEGTAQAANIPAAACTAAEFRGIITPGAQLVKLAGGMQFIEGPAWISGGLVFSDIPANELKGWSVAGGLVTFAGRAGTPMATPSTARDG